MANALEKRLTTRVLRGDMTYAALEKALRDQPAYRVDRTGLSNSNQRVFPKIKTARRVIQLGYYVSRSANGFFIGWMESYTRDGQTKTEWYARRTRKRLKAFLHTKQDSLAAGNEIVPWNSPYRDILPPPKPKADPVLRMRKQRLGLINKAAKRETMLSYEIAWFRSEEEALKLQDLNNKVGKRFVGGTAMTRKPELDKKRPKLFACLYVLN